MKHFSIEANLREDLGKKATKKIRLEGNIPCVIYGAETNVHFYTHLSAVRKLIYTPEVMFADIKVDGKVKIARIQELQFHPVSDAILHIDFYEVKEDQPLSIQIPVKTVGSSEGVKAGGKLKINSRRITVQGLMKDIPESFEIDITPLNIGDGIRVKDLSADNIEFVDHKSKVIVMVASARGAAEEEEEEGEEGEEAEEGEEGEEKATKE